MSETIFSKILRGEVPCHKVYEDEHVLAFLDVFPLSRGHTLVIPKEAKATMAELSDGAGAGLGRARGGERRGRARPPCCRTTGPLPTRR